VTFTNFLQYVVVRNLYFRFCDVTKFNIEAVSGRKWSWSAGELEAPRDSSVSF
jgi:hypothetical protein